MVTHHLVLPTLHNLTEEPNVRIPEPGGRHRLDADVDLLIRGNIRPKLEQRPATGNGEARRTDTEIIPQREIQIQRTGVEC